MDVGDFLEFERALERDRIVNAASEIKEITRLAILARDFFDLSFLCNRGFDLLRNREGGSQQFFGLALSDTAEARREMNREQVEGLDLSKKALSSGNADLGAAS